MRRSFRLHNQEGADGPATTTISAQHCFCSLLQRAAVCTVTAGAFPLRRLLHRCRRYSNQARCCFRSLLQRAELLLLTPPLLARCRSAASSTVAAATTISARHCFRSLLQCAALLLLTPPLLAHCRCTASSTVADATTISARRCFRSLHQRAAFLLLTSPLMARCRCATSSTVAAATTISARHCFRSLLYQIWTVVGSAVGKIGNGQRLALGLVWLLVS